MEIVFLILYIIIQLILFVVGIILSIKFWKAVIRLIKKLIEKINKI